MGTKRRFTTRNPESKLESMQWKHVDSPPPNKFRTQLSAGKVMATFLGEFEGLRLGDYLHAEKTTTGQHYVEIMFKLCDAIKQKRRRNCDQDFGVFTTMRLVQKSFVAHQAVWDYGFLQINHPARSGS